MHLFRLPENLSESKFLASFIKESSLDNTADGDRSRKEASDSPSIEQNATLKSPLNSQANIKRSISSSQEPVSSSSVSAPGRFRSPLRLMKENRNFKLEAFCFVFQRLQHLPRPGLYPRFLNSVSALRCPCCRSLSSALRKVSYRIIFCPFPMSVNCMILLTLGSGSDKPIYEDVTPPETPTSSVAGKLFCSGFSVFRVNFAA